MRPDLGVAVAPPVLRAGAQRTALMDTYPRARILVSGTLRDALRAIEDSGLEIALAVDDRERLVGILTDGDIRRCLLDGVSLDAGVEPFLQHQYKSVSPETERSAVLDLMQALTLSQLPIVDGERRLVGLHTLHEILGATQRPNWAVVMAGGRGERLRPYTDDVPKPMLTVAGRPILERIILHLVSFGIRRIFLAVNYKGEMIERHFGDGRSLGCTVEYLRETMPLGTGGALSLLPQSAAHPILVLNGDLLTQVDIERLLAFHDQGAYQATVGIYEYTHTVPLGVVELDGPHVVGMREKPTEVWMVNAGIYVLEPALLGRVPADTYFGLPALIEECLGRNEPIGGFNIKEDWIDIGQHHELKRARGEA